ncbi:MAG TPA: phytanoyl-CoA dioxygenase family protein [Thermoanaerobaculia bacterium]
MRTISIDMTLTLDRNHWNINRLPIDTPAFDVDAYVNRLPSVHDFDLRTKLQEWKESGIVRFESCVDDDMIEKLLEDILYLSENRSRFDLEIEFRGTRLPLKEMTSSPLSDTGVKFNCLENLSLAARELSLNRLICEFLGHVFLDAPVVLQSLTFWRGSEQPVHIDYPYVRTQTRLPHLAASWIPLENIHPDAGPLAYYPGSHRHELITPFDWGDGSIVFEPDSVRSPAEFSAYLYSEISRLGLQRQVFLPQRGDVLIWHGNLLHEGTHVEDPSRTRRSYITHYTSLASYPREHMLPDAMRTAAFTRKHGGYVFEHPWVRDERELPSWKQGSTSRMNASLRVP